MTKVTLQDVTAGFGSASQTNENYDLIEAGFEKALFRDGTGPNQMEADLDMNDNDILNAKDVYTANLYLNGVRVPQTTVENLDDIFFDTVAAASSAEIDDSKTLIKTLGFSSVGVGGATYVAVGSEPSHGGKFQSADNRWWEKTLEPEVYATRDAFSCTRATENPDGKLVQIAGLVYQVNSSSTGASSATNDLGVDGLKPYGTIQPGHFGFTFGSSAVPAHTALINYLNQEGGARSANDPLLVEYPSGLYDMSSGAAPALTVSSVLFKMNNARIRLADGPFLTLGESGTLVENIKVEGGYPHTALSDLPLVKPANITGATQTNPVVITATGHGYTTGQMIRVQGITTGMQEINEREFYITVIDANSFSLDDEDGTSHTAYTSGGTTWPATDCAYVKGINCARVFIVGVEFFRLPHLFKASAPSGSTISSVYIKGPEDYGLGHASYNLIDIDTINAAAGAGLYVSVNGFPYVPPTNPAIVPKAITGATQANPVVITCVGHGLTSDNKARFRDVGGMTELNGNDYSITVIDADTFSLDDTDGTGFTAYTSGGAVAGVHWGEEYKTAVVSINGKWDTAVISSCVLQHYNWLWKLRTAGTMSFIRSNDVIFDYVGSGHLHAIYAGANIGEFNVQGGWNFALNGDWYSFEVESGGSLLDVKVHGHVFGLVGGEILNDSGRVTYADFDGCRVQRLGRMKSGTSYGWRFVSSNTKDLRLSGNRFEDPTIRNGAGSDAYLLPTHAIAVGTQLEIATITDNHVGAREKHYDIVKPTTGDGAGRRLLNNTRADGRMPEYISLEVPVVTTGAFTWRNTLGCPVNVSVFGGTVSSINLSYLNLSDVEITTTATGQTEGVFTVGPGQLITISNSVAPTMRVIPVA